MLFVDFKNLLACPNCLSAKLEFCDEKFICQNCRVEYKIFDGIPAFFAPKAKVLNERHPGLEFWDEGWKKRNGHLLKFDKMGVLKEREKYYESLVKEGYPSVGSQFLRLIKGKRFLNIGCGGGYEGLLFSGFGAKYVGVDFSQSAARYTKSLIETAGLEASTFQAEAEALPFQENHFEVIYSSGVLHHTPNIEKAFGEVFRVLKPGGTAMIGLYPTYSIMFLWYRLHAVLSGNFSKKNIELWLHKKTEGEWQTESRVNRWTKTYSKSEFASMLERSGFKQVSIKQTPLQIRSIPIFGKIVKLLLPKPISDAQLGPFGGMLIAVSKK